MKYITLIIFVFFFISCYQNKDSVELIGKAENCVLEDPDSALFYLGSIIAPKNLQDSDYAKYAILLVRTHCKTNISLLGDTIIDFSISYYKKTNDDLNLVRAYLQAGRVKEEEQNYIKAQGYYIDAIRLATQCGHDRLALISTIELTDMYFLIDNYIEAQKWLFLLLKSNFTDEVNKLSIEKKIADCYIMMNQPKEALKIYNTIISDNLDLLSDIHKNKALAYYDVKDYSKSINEINRALTLCNKDELFVTIYSLKAEIYNQLHQSDSAYYCTQKALEYASLSDRLDIVVNIYNDPRKEKILLKSPDESFWNKSIDSYIGKSRYKTFSTLNSIHNNQKATNIAQELIIRNQQFVIVIITILLLLIIMIFMYIRSRKYLINRHNKQIKQKEEQYALKEIGFIETINNYQSSLEDYLLMYKKLFKLSLLNNKNGQFLRDFNRIIFNNDEPFQFDWGQFKIILNQVYPQFEANLLYRYSTALNQREIEVILLQKGGFQINDICEILGLTSTTIYHRNSDIRKKLNMEVGEDIIVFFDNFQSYVDLDL